jgi:acyl transferase domain-containing protein/NADPH:quinone reductase-like Zn-dependent oxidoreductase/aryl carrier-like protein
VPLNTPGHVARSAANAIAVVGMSGRFPGAADPEALWQLLIEGRDAVTEAPADRPWLRELHDSRIRAAGRIPTTRGGFLPDLDLFDAAFFDMSPREARRTDPQLRLLLELAYESAQDAGVPIRGLARSRTGVFVGNLYGDYWHRQVADLEGLDLHAELGASARAALAGRLAYAYDLRGPAVVVDTACSSSLAAIHLACQSLRLGESEFAIAGGANIILTPYNTITFSAAGALCPDGRCKFGDASANGYVRAEAVGLLLLKPLARAVADGDRVRAVILGGAANNDGFTGSGMAAPTVEGQVDALRAAYAQAGVDPREVDFVEAHGTGTPIGDRVELTALSDVLGPRPADRRCVVGSAKVCLGHSEAAAGVVGLIKVVLCLEHRMVPGNPQLSTPTPAIDWTTSPLLLPSGPVSLPDTGRPLLAGINSFGATGTNVHLVLTSAPPRPSSPPTGTGSERSAILAISARSDAALRELVERYTNVLDASPPLAELCAAAATRRDHWERRLAVTGNSASDMTAALREFLAGGDHPGVARSPREGGERPRIVFVFPGQGSQWLGMGRGLLADAAFREAVEGCDAVIREHGGWSLIDALRDEDPAWLRQTAKVQPALWAMGVSLAALWRSWGIEPDVVLGQSQGEIAAAHCAGALDLDQAGRLSCLRAALIEDLAPPGAMCWVERPHTDIPGLLENLEAVASVAVVEGPASTVLSGAVDQIERIVAGCARDSVSCQRVDVGYAAHSPQIDAVRQPLLDGLAGLSPGDTAVPFLSTVTGGVLPGTDLDRDYWWRNLRQPVRLDQAVRAERSAGPVVFVQMAPHPVLTTALRANAAAEGVDALVLESLRRGRPELSCLHGSLAALYTAGYDLDWHQVHHGLSPLPDLPRYPWQRSRHWHQADGFPWPPIGEHSLAVPPSRQEAPSVTAEPTHPWLTEPVSGRPELRGHLTDSRDRFLLGHRVADQPVMPGAGLLELAMAAATRLAGDAAFVLTDIEFHRLLLLDDARVDWELRVGTETEGEGWALDIAGRRGGDAEWTSHARARLSTTDRTTPAVESLADIRRRCPDWQAGEQFYRRHSGAGNEWQGVFRGIAELWRGDGEVLARLRPAPRGAFWFHPATLDSCLQTAAIALPRTEDGGDRGFVLTGVRQLRPHRRQPDGGLWSHARVAPEPGGGLSVDITVLDDAGAVVAELTGVGAKHLSTSQRVPAPVRATGDGQHLLRWQEVSVEALPAEPGHWLLVCGGTELDGDLARRLTEAGGVVSTIRHGAGFAAGANGGFLVAPGSVTDLEQALAQASHRGAVRGVVSLLALSARADRDASVREVQWTATDLCATAVALAKGIGAGPQPTPALFLLTQGAQAAVETDTPSAPWQAVLWGLGPALGRERTGPVVMVDLDENQSAAELAAVLLSPGTETQLALRGGRRWAPRLVPGPSPQPSQERDVLAVRTDGSSGGLRLAHETRRAPGPGQVEIEVSHAGLNYHDVLDAVGTSDGQGDDEPTLGFECAGSVVRLGTGVTEFAVGEEVLAWSHPGLRSYVVQDVCLVAAKPARLSPAEAASLPVAFCTAYFGLVELARLQPGERVLIHSGTGGVGQAAIDLARRRGAIIYATAGTAAKRDLLRALGASEVADSRTTEFAGQFREHGVDVVLNTLSGDAVEANFALLNPFGRYVDLTKKDITDGRALSMAVFSENRSYQAVDLLDLYHRAPQRLGAVLREVTGLVDRGELAPPATRVFPAEDGADAFSLMARSGHTGKLALAFPRSRARSAVRPDATYLVTGGLSGVGGLTAQWLADEGARHLLLTGRSEVVAGQDSADPRARSLARLRSSGIDVEYAAVDVADADSMAELLSRRDHQGLPAVAGVVHSAAVLDPAPGLDLSAEDLDRTLRPKVAGGWTLHQLFADRPLDFFVLYSSAVSLLAGLSAGSQLGAYAAANAFLDALAAHRRAAGLSATVVNWGYWSEVGLAARLSERGGHDVRPAGMAPLRPADAPGLFAAMLAADGRMICLPGDWHAYAGAYPRDADAPLLRELLRDRPQFVPAAVPVPAAALTPAPAPVAAPVAVPAPVSSVAEVEDWLVARVAGVLGLPPGEVDRSRGMNKLGLDSLMAAEVRNQLRRDRGFEVTIPQLLEASSLRALARDLAGQDRS